MSAMATTGTGIETTSVDTITLNIDGKKVEAPRGSTVLEAALAAGTYIPTLCYDHDLKPYGACRLCIVEIEGMRGLATSCTTAGYGSRRQLPPAKGERLAPHHSGADHGQPPR